MSMVSLIGKKYFYTVIFHSELHLKDLSLSTVMI